MRDFKIGGARSASSIWNLKYDFRPKLHDTKFNYHFIKAILKSQNSISTNILLSERRYNFAKLGKFTDLYGGGRGREQVCAPPPTIQTSVKFRDFEDLYLRYFSTDHFQTGKFYQF